MPRMDERKLAQFSLFRKRSDFFQLDFEILWVPNPVIDNPRLP
jgi:hypothetical protein